MSVVVSVLPELVDGSLNVGHGCCHDCPVVYNSLCCFILFCEGLKQCPKGTRGGWRADDVVNDWPGWGCVVLGKYADSTC